MKQMVQNGEGKCTGRALSGIEEKTISEDEKACSKVLIPWLYFLSLFFYVYAIVSFLIFHLLLDNFFYS